jgi:uncharacterized membrane protein
MMNGWDGWDWVWMTFMIVAVWGGLPAVIGFTIKALRGSRRRSETPEPDAMTVLETRFAKGEISLDEFEERRRMLQRS